MLKKLVKLLQWPLAVLVIIGAIVLVTYKEHKASDKYQRDRQSHVSAGMASRNGNQANGSDECQNPEEYMPWWYVLVAWPDGITVWALLATLSVIVWQSNETRRSANSTTVAANAALRQTEHTETTERAWLILNFISMKDKELKDGEIAECRWSIKNVGSTPAVLLETKARFHVIRLYDGMPEDPVKALPAIPNYGNPITVNERLLAPHDSIGYFVKWERDIDGTFSEFALTVDTRDVWMIVAYGYVKYRDIFGKERESRSCDFTVVAVNRIIADFRPHPKAPAAYNRCT